MNTNTNPSEDRVPAAIRVVHITRNDDAFGLTDAGESVYIPPFFVRTLGLKYSQYRDVLLIRNDPEHVERGVPWRVCFVEPCVKSGAVEHEPSVDEKVIDGATDEEIVLEELEVNGIMSTKQLAEALDVDTISARNVLDSMHRAERIVRADVFRTITQGKAGVTVWALTTKEFTKFAEESDDD